MKKIISELQISVKGMYLFSLVLSIISVILYYAFRYTNHTSINVVNGSVFIVPIIFIIICIFIDIYIKKINFSKSSLFATIIYLPTFMAFHFFALSVGEMFSISRNVILWYFLLFLPLLLVSVFIYMLSKHFTEKSNLFIITKYIFSTLLFAYGVFIWYQYLFLL